MQGKRSKHGRVSSGGRANGYCWDVGAIYLLENPRGIPVASGTPACLVAEPGGGAASLGCAKYLSLVQGGCGFNVSYMQRHLDTEDVAERTSFAQTGHRVRCTIPTRLMTLEACGLLSCWAVVTRRVSAASQ